MHGQLKARQRFEGRMLVFHAGSLLLLTLLFLRLVDLQWLRHEDLALQANQNRINIVPVLPTRGEITDIQGRALAINQVKYRVQMIPERVTDMTGTLAVLAKQLHWNAHKISIIRKRIARSRSDRPVHLDDQLTWQQAAPLAARLHHFPGVDVLAGTHRYYPYGELTSHLIGYLSLATPEDVRNGFLPTELVGRTGVERAFESLLHGKPGYQQEEVDARGRRVAVLGRSAPETGQALRLSLDVDVQRAAARALGKRTGAVVVMDVHTGEIIALLSRPGFDPNRFITGLETEQWQQWLDDPRKPLLNRAIQAAYPPASTFKLLTGLAGLRIASPLARGYTDCPGYLELADRRLRCWNRKGHQHINLHRALVESCDVYFYALGDQVGMQRLSAEAALWGLGSPTGIGLTPEATGIIPGQHPRLMAGQRRQNWFRGETMIAAIGQGAVTVTPLQLARLAAAIANGGLLLRPKLTAGQVPEVIRQIEVNPAHLKKIHQAMRDVIASPKGTAHAQLAWLPWKVAGKTGTAQVIAMAQDDEKPAASAYDRHKDHAWFMGYAPFDDPRVAFAVFVEHGGHGGHAAAPVAAAIIRALAARHARRAEVASR
ncbi:MAG: penicillin-binding protein 2 [Mariprofundaceae bacterium]|nr:penicillin-binding protein 2 [Mariprofundaceae bacterium]